MNPETLGLLHQDAQYRWMTGEQCFATLRVFFAAGIYIRPIGANEDFAEYYRLFLST